MLIPTTVLTDPGSGGASSRELAYAEQTSDVSVTATTEATAVTVATAAAVSLDGSTTIIVECYSPALKGPAGGGFRQTIAVVYDAVNGGAAASLGIWGTSFSGNAEQVAVAACMRRRFTPAVGSHVFSFRSYGTVSGGVVSAGPGGTGSTIPAYIRVEQV